ncbi:MAG: histidine kinase [Gemmatimonadaceae bacterium]
MTTPLAPAATHRTLPASVYISGAWTIFGIMHGVVWTASSDDPSSAVRWAMPTALAVAWAWALITPLVFRLTRAGAPSRIGWGRSLFLHAGAMLLCVAFMTWWRHVVLAALTERYTPSFLPDFLFWFDVWLFVYATLVVVGHALSVRRRYVDRTVRAHLLEAQLARARLQFLELQLQPHFLFNALNAIQELAHEAPQAAERMLRKLHTLLDISLQRSGQDEVTLQEELQALEPYIDIQKTRFSDWLDVEMCVPADVRDALVPHLILQPLVENAIRHGLSVRPAAGRVTIRAERQGDRLLLRVEDNGVGLRPPSSRSSAREGIGLRNASERLRQLYGASHHFELRDAPAGGVVVELDIPYRDAGSAGTSAPLSASGELHIPADALQDLSNWHTGEYSAGFVVPETPMRGPSIASEAAPAPARLVDGGRGTRVRYDTPTPADPSAASAASLSPAPALTGRNWFIILGLWVALAVMWTSQMVLYTQTRMSGEWKVPWVALARLQFATSVIWLALSPIVFALARQFRIDSANWMRTMPLHIVFGMATGFLHTSLMRLTGLSEMPVLSPVNLNPLIGDFFVYFGLLAWSHARDFVAWYRVRELEGARLSARIAGSRFQSLRVQLRPHFLLSTLDLLADLVHRDVPRAERLIARLADTLRLTLESGRDSTTSIRQELELLQVCVETHRLGIRPHVRLVASVAPEALSLQVPSRLLCTIADDLLAPDVLNPGSPLTVRVEVQRASDATRIHIRAEREGWDEEGGARTRAGKTAGGGGDPATGRRSTRSIGERHMWWRTKSVAEAAVADAGSLVSVVFPDRMTAVLIIADAPARDGSHVSASLVGAVA